MWRKRLLSAAALLALAACRDPIEPDGGRALAAEASLGFAEAEYCRTLLSADLVFSAPATLTVTPMGVAPGGKVQLPSWTVKNIGTVASNAFSNGFYLSTDAIITAADVYLTGNSNSALAPGASYTWGGPRLTIPADVASGNHFIGILVDRTNTTGEACEGNNFKSTPLTVSRPDLIVSALTHSGGLGVHVITGDSGAYPITGDVALLTATVMNIGSVPSGPSKLEFLIGEENPGSPGTRFDVPALAPGGSFSHFRFLTLPRAQNYRTMATADNMNVVDEWDEGNNAATDDYLVAQRDQEARRGTSIFRTHTIGSTYFKARLAQVVTPGVTAGGIVQLSTVRFLVQVRLQVKCYSGSLVVEIQGVTQSGSPNGTILTSETVPAANVTGPFTYSYQSIIFSSPVWLAAGYRFAIVLTNPTGTCEIADTGDGDLYPWGHGWRDGLPEIQLDGVSYSSSGWQRLSGGGDDFAFVTAVRDPFQN